MSGPHPSQTASLPSGGYAGDLSPKESWDLLSKQAEGQLVDVRTEAEWNFVGVPDLSPLKRRVCSASGTASLPGPIPTLSRR